MRLSVIIPALNEAGNIGETIARVLREPGVEVIVVDGGSKDKTAAEATAAGARVITSPPGRALQMNAGAHAASGDTLLFLHADTRLPGDYPMHIEETLSLSSVVAGAFRLRIDSGLKRLRLIEALANFRSQWMGMPYGDQGIFLRKTMFDEVGGVPDMPIMEDYELMRRLKKTGRIAVANACATTSGRRWERLGVLRTTVVNQLVIIGYHMGVPPERLKGWYGRAKAL